ncbi:MAG: hypothetical protein IT176_03675 [Acidobacteria bacterium]|nr:hypothetical protein [Acidobacteriota bacterium]
MRAVAAGFGPPGTIAVRAVAAGFGSPGAIAVRAVAAGFGSPGAIAGRAVAAGFGPPGAIAVRAMIVELRLPRPISMRFVAGGPVGPGPIVTRRPFGLPVAPGTIALRPLVPRLISLLLPVEAIPGIAVLAAGPPVASSRAGCCVVTGSASLRFPAEEGRAGALAPLEVVVLGLRRVPQPPARKPLHRGVRVLALELVQRGQQLLPLARAERGRPVVDQDGPEGVAWRHASLSQQLAAQRGRPVSKTAVRGDSLPDLSGETGSNSALIAASTPSTGGSMASTRR